MTGIILQGKRIKTQVKGKRLVRPKGRLKAARCSSNTYSKTRKSRSWRTIFFPKVSFDCQKRKGNGISRYMAR